MLQWRILTSQISISMSLFAKNKIIAKFSVPTMEKDMILVQLPENKDDYPKVLHTNQRQEVEVSLDHSY